MGVLSPKLCSFFGLVEGACRTREWVISAYEAQARRMGYEPYDDSVLKNVEIRELLQISSITPTSVVARLMLLVA